MGQEVYVLAKVSSKSTPKVLKNNNTIEDGEWFLVKNVTLPAILLWTPIDYHELNDDNLESLQDRLLNELPIEFLRMNTEAQGFLLFADGGEPCQEWPYRASYDDLVAEVTDDPDGEGSFYRWVPIPEEKLSSSEESPMLDDFLVDLKEEIILFIMIAKKQKDADMARKILRESLGKKYQSLESKIEKWVASF